MMHGTVSLKRKWLGSCHGGIITRERANNIHWLRGWVVSRRGVDTVAKQNGLPHQESDTSCKLQLFIREEILTEQ